MTYNISNTKIKKICMSILFLKVEDWKMNYESWLFFESSMNPKEKRCWRRIKDKAERKRCWRFWKEINIYFWVTKKISYMNKGFCFISYSNKANSWMEWIFLKNAKKAIWRRKAVFLQRSWSQINWCTTHIFLMINSDKLRISWIWTLSISWRSKTRLREIISMIQRKLWICIILQIICKKTFYFWQNMNIIPVHYH